MHRPKNRYKGSQHGLPSSWVRSRTTILSSRESEDITQSLEGKNSIRALANQRRGRIQSVLPECMDDYNRRFARAPRNAHDAHRPLQDDENLDEIFSWQEERKLSGNLTVHFKRATYLIEPGPETTVLAVKQVRYTSGPMDV